MLAAASCLASVDRGSFASLRRHLRGQSRWASLTMPLSLGLRLSLCCAKSTAEASELSELRWAQRAQPARPQVDRAEHTVPWSVPPRLLPCRPGFGPNSVESWS